MIQEFRNFIMRGNVLELAVAVIIAGAFGAVVTSFTNDIVLPPIGMALGGVDFSELAYTLQAAEISEAGEILEPAVEIRYGAFIQTIINFLIIAFIIFMIVRTYNHMTAKPEPEPAPAPDPGPSEKDLLMQIRDLLAKK